MILLYNGTFEGFLTLVYDVYYEKLACSEIIKQMPTSLSFERIHEIFSDPVKAQKVLEAIQKRFSKEHQERIYHTFLCDTKAFEKPLLEFIQIGFKNISQLQNINNPSLYFLHALEKELLHHVHKMYGFTRFEELEDGTLYAKIKTKFNVLPFLGNHFAKRLGAHPFIIHDIERSLAFLKTETTKEIRSIASFDAPLYSDDEAMFQQLWKSFFKTVAIEARYNPKCQRTLVPLLYRTYMSEFQE